jgi:hypothetical protein
VFEQPKLYLKNFMPLHVQKWSGISRFIISDADFSSSRDLVLADCNVRTKSSRSADKATFYP